MKEEIDRVFGDMNYKYGYSPKTMNVFGNKIDTFYDMLYKGTWYNLAYDGEYYTALAHITKKALKANSLEALKVKMDLI